MGAQLVHHIVSSLKAISTSEAPHYCELSSEWSNQRMGIISHHSTVKATAPSRVHIYSHRLKVSGSKDKECPPLAKCCLKALGCPDVRVSCGLAALPDEEQRCARVSLRQFNG